MQIKKIDAKLSFDVEAQKKCPHGKTMLKDSCATDCVSVSWVAANALQVVLDATRPKNRKSGCYSRTTISCSWSHLT